MVSLANRDPYGIRCVTCHGLGRVESVPPGEPIRCATCDGSGRRGIVPAPLPTEPAPREEVLLTLAAAADLHEVAPALEPVELRRRLVNLWFQLDSVITRMR